MRVIAYPRCIKKDRVLRILQFEQVNPHLNLIVERFLFLVIFSS